MHIVQAIVSIVIAQMAGVIGSVFTSSSIPDWYAYLEKPAFNPPNWLFGPAWITLYTLMGIAAYLVWKRRAVPGAKMALGVYGVQLVLNAVWSILFFGMRNPEIALMEILVLLVMIIVTTVLFWRIHRGAGLLMLPYIAWVCFATYLNYGIWQLN